MTALLTLLVAPSGASLSSCCFADLLSIAVPQVYQRQLMKADLAAATIEVGQGSNDLSHYELKQLFHLETADGASSTQRLVPGKGAAANAGGAGGGKGQSSSSAGATGSSSHISWMDLSRPGELPKALAAAVAAGGISAINQEDHAGTVTAVAVAAVAGGVEAPSIAEGDDAADGTGSRGSEAVGGDEADLEEDDVMCLEVE